jgi:transmembrane sensor
VETKDSMREQIAAEADEWLLKLHAAEPAYALREAFTEWLMRSPAHIEAYLTVSRTWHALAAAHEGEWAKAALIAAARTEREPDNVTPLRGDRLPAPALRPRAVRSRALAALAACAALAGVGVWLFRGYLPSGDDFKTAVGEQRSITLSDRSVVFLNTDSEVRLRWTARERHIDLLHGEARFQVAKNAARPFIVATREASVRAVGTVFNVRTGEAITQVAVLEGRVEVKADLGAANSAPAHNEADLLLAAGQRAAVTRLGVEPDVGPPIERVAAWTERRLVFRGDPLGAVVAEFNRYRTQALVVDDPALAEVRINGVFELDDPASLLTYLRNFESVQVTQGSDGREHLARTSH